jgi:hypothetical protein
VIATLTWFSETWITITNNEWLDTYTFTDNWNFTFEFEDLAGNTWSQIATVTWITHITIWTPWSFSFPEDIEINNHDTQFTWQFASWEYFSITDLDGNDVWWYTTISATHLSWPNNNIITNDNLFIKSNWIETLSWTQNSWVEINNLMNNYIPLSWTFIYIYRNSASNDNKTWQYGDQPYLKINIPAYQPSGTYSWTIIFTLYEN